MSGFDAGGSQPMKVFESAAHSSAAHSQCSFVVGHFEHCVCTVPTCVSAVSDMGLHEIA